MLSGVNERVMKAIISPIELLRVSDVKLGHSQKIGGDDVDWLRRQYLPMAPKKCRVRVLDRWRL